MRAGRPPPEPQRRGAALTIINNPFAGAYHEDIQFFMDVLKPLGLDMARRLIAALGGDATAIEGYGKAAIVGSAGELEHGALWHVPGGYAMRELLGDAKAIVPSTKKVGGARHAHRCARHPYQCFLCAQPFRRHGGRRSRMRRAPMRWR